MEALVQIDVEEISVERLTLGWNCINATLKAEGATVSVGAMVIAVEILGKS
jgi:hypothetical protein